MFPLNISTVSAHQILRTLFFVAVAVLFVAYVHFQARNLLAGPQITLTTDPPEIEHEQLINLEGTAKNITLLTMNGTPISTDDQGNFSHPLVLENGYTIMTLTAHDRFGHTTTVTRRFVYLPASS